MQLNNSFIIRAHLLVSEYSRLAKSDPTPNSRWVVSDAKTVTFILICSQNYIYLEFNELRELKSDYFFK